MKSLTASIFATVLLSLTASCSYAPDPDTAAGSDSTFTSNDPVGGGCDGCDLMYIGMPVDIPSQDSSPGWKDGNQQLIISGIMYQPDGITPAPDVTVYYWHTNDQGLYTPDAQTPSGAEAHGKYRGWVKSAADGSYTIQTCRPAAYPDDDIPQHIHLAIREPDIANEYFADLYFEDDPLYARHLEKYGRADRAGSELLHITKENHVQLARHNIILGLNIPNYPVRKE
jgi:protocatechuate 3,4-dioxygenase, beta subunit